LHIFYPHLGKAGDQSGEMQLSRSILFGGKGHLGLVHPAQEAPMSGTGGVMDAAEGTGTEGLAFTSTQGRDSSPLLVCSGQRTNVLYECFHVL